VAAQSLVRGLALELIQAAHDPSQLEKAWGQLDATERQMPEVAIQAAECMLALGGSSHVPSSGAAGMGSMGFGPRRPCRRISASSWRWCWSAAFSQSGGKPTVAWLSRIESAQMGNPRDCPVAVSGRVICMHLSLWQAQQFAQAALSNSRTSDSGAGTWQALALAGRAARRIPAAATEAWRNARPRGDGLVIPGIMARIMASLTDHLIKLTDHRDRDLLELHWPRP